MAEKDTLRPRMKKVVAEVDKHFWIAGELLAEIRDKERYTTWGFQEFWAYCEEELRISRSRASRLIRVLQVFGDCKDSHDLDDVGWSCLSEALPIVKQADLDTAIDLAKEGLEAIRRWKDARKRKQSQMNLPLEEQEDWITVKGARLPPDAYRDWKQAEQYVRVILGRNGTKVDDQNPWRVFQAIAQEALAGLVAQIQPDEMARIEAENERQAHGGEIARTKMAQNEDGATA